MSPALTIFLLFAGWFTVAAAMLWGVMRISRRHHPVQPKLQAAPEKPIAGTVNAH
mgnify:CR=1 FL=1